MIPVFVVPVATMPLCEDGFFLPQGMPSAQEICTLKPTAWCPRLMLGDAKHECIIWNKSWDNMSPEPMLVGADLSSPTAPLVLKRMEAIVGKEKAAAIVELYNISVDTSDRDTFSALERMTTDGMYSAIIYLNAHNLIDANDSKTRVWAYHFDVPSPFDNAWKGLAHHSFDNVLIWGILRHMLSEAHQKAADRMQRAWVQFADGEEPWEELSVQGRRMVFELDYARVVAENENQGRAYKVWQELEAKGLMADFAAVCEELCLRRQEIVTRR